MIFINWELWVYFLDCGDVEFDIVVSNELIGILEYMKFFDDGYNGNFVVVLVIMICVVLIWICINIVDIYWVDMVYLVEEIVCFDIKG